MKEPSRDQISMAEGIRERASGGVSEGYFSESRLGKQGSANERSDSVYVAMWLCKTKRNLCNIVPSPSIPLLVHHRQLVFGARQGGPGSLTDVCLR